MSKYTTGEIAKLCGVSVRTVQYYDSRNILVPSATSEGGRRLYSEEDLKRMRIICFLRETDMPINGIAQLFSEEYPEKIISILLDQQEATLRTEISQQQKSLDMIEAIKLELKNIDNFSVESIGDIAHIMKKKDQFKKMRRSMLLTGLPLAVFQWVAALLWYTHGLWWLFAVWAAVAIVFGICVSKYYYSHIAYICPECHEIFIPSFKEIFWAYHTPKMRRLTCPKCKHKGLCVEVYHEEDT